MVAITSIRHIAESLPQAVNNGTDLAAREKMAFANTISGYAMDFASTTSEHSLEHAMSAYHQQLPHGAGLIMISKAYFSHFVAAHVCDDRFIEMAKAMGMPEAQKPEDFITALVKLQEACGVADLKMSDYGIKPEEFVTLAKNAQETMGGLFAADRVPLSIEDCVNIYQQSYK